MRGRLRIVGLGVLEKNMKKPNRTLRTNMRLARAIWGPLSRFDRLGLVELLEKYSFSVVLGDIQYLERRWYVTHAGLLRLASRYQCNGIRVSPVRGLCEPASGRWVFKATVFRSSNSRGFVGYGDADPSNTSVLVRGAVMRVAETRAVNRALRKAYGIGLCSVEELGSRSKPPNSSNDHRDFRTQEPTDGSANGQTRLRDQLCLLIRKYNLDPTAVKAYAA